MSDTPKIAYNQETATSTEKHNDRSMYSEAYPERWRNQHWDMYACGSTWEAEQRFYEETFGETLETQNARAVEMSKYDRVMTMEQYHQKHMPKECIFSLGSMENRVDGDDEFLEQVIPKVIEQYERAGANVISWDLHNDEAGVSHVHMRYAYVTKDRFGNNKIDAKTCLKEHGIEPPNPSKPERRGNLRLDTVNNTIRALLEDEADNFLASRGVKVDRKRTRRKHESVNEYKTRMAKEEREAELEKLDDAITAKQEYLDNMTADKTAELEEREAKLEKNEKGVTFARDALFDLVGTVDPDGTQGISNVSKLIKRVKELINTLRREISELTQENSELKTRLERQQPTPAPAASTLDRVAAASAALGDTVPRGTQTPLDGLDWSR